MTPGVPDHELLVPGAHFSSGKKLKLGFHFRKWCCPSVILMCSVYSLNVLPLGEQGTATRCKFGEYGSL
eukprot:4429776-Amphidinium_carterae.1